MSLQSSRGEWPDVPGESSVGVVIVGDIRLYREGLELVLGAQGGIEVLSTAGGWSEAADALRRHRPALALVDMEMARGHAIVRDLAHSFPEVCFVGLTVSSGDDSVLECAAAGLAGYVRRDGSIEDLVVAIEAAVRGEFLCPPRVVTKLARRLAALSPAEAVGTGMERLTERELEILGCMAQGKGNKAIARDLSISVSTVKNHAHNLFEKMGVHSRAEAVEHYRRGAFAIRSDR